MTSKLLFVPCALLIGCADVRTSTSPAGQVDVNAAEPPEASRPTLSGGFIFEPESCADHSVFLRAHFSYSDGSSTDNVKCQYEFADGSVADGCALVKSLPDLGPVTLRLHDDVTGAELQAQEIVGGPASFSAKLDVTTDGDSIVWHARPVYGTADNVSGADVHITITPADNLVVDDPSIFDQRDGSVGVTASATYTIAVDAGINFGDVGGCSAHTEVSLDFVCGNGPS
jgi:hypothetical protein